MATGRQKRTRSSAPNVPVTTAEGMSTARPIARASSSPAYKKTRSPNKDLVAQEQPSGSGERKATAEEDELNKKTSSTPSPTAAADAVPIETEDKIEPAVDPVDPAAADDNANGNDTPIENEEKAEKPSHNDKSKDDATGDLPEINNFNPVVFRSATTTLQETLTTMNAKVMMHTHISCDDLDTVYKQFDVFINCHPTLAPVVYPMLNPKNLATLPQVDNTAAGGNGAVAGGSGVRVENISGIAANLSSMLSNLENSVLAAAAAAAGGDGGNEAEIVQEPQAPTQTMPPLRAGWDTSSILQFQPAVASGLSDRVIIKNNNNNISADGVGEANAATNITTMTTQGGGGAENTMIQEKIRRAIVAAQAGYNNNNNNTVAAATYDPRMSSQLDSHLNHYNHHHNQVQSCLASGAPEQQHYYQPSAADSAAIAAATAAALAGQSRAGVDKTPALELLKALSNVNYTSKGPSMMNNNNNANFVNARMQNNQMFPQRAPSYGNAAAAAAYDDGEDEEGEDGSGSDGYADLEMDRGRSPTPTINPNTNRPLRRVVVQKAADELAASALVSLGAGAEATGTAPASKGNKFNRNGSKRIAPSRFNTEHVYADYPYYSDGGGGAGDAGVNRKRNSPSKGGGGGGGGGASTGVLPPAAGPSTAPQRGTTPQPIGGFTDSDVTAKVQLLMLMAQNLGEMQNPSATNNNTNTDDGGVVGGVRSRAASEEGAQGKAIA
ncbi:hypothetical protein Ndes2437B_g06930 [Nannochloris sp. 'desiccata']|nr:hypothetical protein KSW81_005284 [Chlorella desiccata (nom. nud.)]